MGKLLLRLLVVVGLLSSLASSPAHAASITLEVGPSGDLVVHNQTSLDVGALAVLVTGATDFTFNDALPTMSLHDSVFVLDIGIPPYSALVANPTFGGVSLVPAGSQALIGTFQISDPVSFEIFSARDVLGGPVVDPFGNDLVPASVSSYRLVCDPGPCPELHYFFVMTFAPEPAVGALAALVVLGLAALASTRRMVSCA